MNPWIADSDSTIGSSRSIASIRSTNPRIGSREVGKTSIIRQSKTDITGRTRPSSVSTAIRQRSSARSTKSVCGNSLNTVKKSAAATRFAVRWLCGSSSAQTQHLRPDHLPHPREQVALRVVVARRDHGPVQPEHHRIDRQRRARAGRGSRRAATRRSPG